MYDLYSLAAGRAPIVAPVRTLCGRTGDLPPPCPLPGDALRLVIHAGREAAAEAMS